MPRAVSHDGIRSNFNVEQVWPSVFHRSQCPLQSRYEVRRVFHLLSFDSVAFRDLAEIDFRIAEITREFAAGLELPASRAEIARACFIVGVVIHDDDEHRSVISRNRPEHFGLSEEDSAVTLNGHHLALGQCELCAESRAKSPA